MKKVLFGLLLLVSFSAFAADVTYTLGDVQNRVTKVHGSVVQFAVTDGDGKYALETLNIAGGNRTTGSAAYVASFKEIHATAGLGLVAETGVKTHPVYFIGAGYGHSFGNRIGVSADVGYKNDFDNVVKSHEVTIGGAVNYALTEKTTLAAGYTRYNGDAKLNVFALNLNSKF